MSPEVSFILHTSNIFIKWGYNNGKKMQNRYIKFSNSINLLQITLFQLSLVTSEQSYMGQPVNIQSALKPLKKSEEIEIKFYDHFQTS